RTAPPQVSQGPAPGGGGGGGGGGGTGGGGTVAPLRTGFNLPPAGETRFVEDEVLADSAAATAGEIAARHGITCFETVRVRLTGRTLHRCRRDRDQTVVEMIRALSVERQIAGAQPIYRYETIQSAGSNDTAEQYAPEKLGAVEAHRLATGSRVTVAVIDSGVDPSHPDLAGAIAGSSGNAGPTSPPLYPAADPSVIAVTATDASDALFSGANRGKYIAVAAPGVDILVPAPDGGYQLTTGTSVAAAEVSGVVALLIERNPRLTPKDVRRIL